MADQHTLAEPRLQANVPTTYQFPMPYGLRDKAETRFLRVNITTARSKVKSRSHHNVIHLQPQTNVPTKYYLPTP